MRKYTFQTDENGEEIAIKTKEWESLQTRKTLESRFKQANIASSKWEFTFDSYQGSDLNGNIPKLKKFVTNFEKAKGVNLYLWSKQNSTQKSTMASVLGMELIAKGYKVRFTLMSTLTTHLQNEQFKDESKTFLEDISDADFLIIDDAFDTRKATMYKSGFQLSFIDTFLRNRFEVECRNTCFTSNFDIEELRESYNQHIYALVKRHVTPFEFNEPIHDFNPDDFWSM